MQQRWALEQMHLAPSRPWLSRGPSIFPMQAKAELGLRKTSDIVSPPEAPQCVTRGRSHVTAAHSSRTGVSLSL